MPVVIASRIVKVFATKTGQSPIVTKNKSKLLELGQLTSILCQTDLVKSHF